jgi:hypothetical protein
VHQAGSTGIDLEAADIADINHPQLIELRTCNDIDGSIHGLHGHLEARLSDNIGHSMITSDTILETRFPVKKTIQNYIFDKMELAPSRPAALGGEISDPALFKIRQPSVLALHIGSQGYLSLWLDTCVSSRVDLKPNDWPLDKPPGEGSQ